MLIVFSLAHEHIELDIGELICNGLSKWLALGVNDFYVGFALWAGLGQYGRCLIVLICDIWTVQRHVLYTILVQTARATNAQHMPLHPAQRTSHIALPRHASKTMYHTGGRQTTTTRTGGLLAEFYFLVLLISTDSR